MIKVVAKGIYKEGKVNEAIKMYQELVEKTRKEVGVISYDLYQNLNDENTLTVIEQWENEDCLTKHMNSEHFKKLVPEIAKLREFAEMDKYKKLL